MAAYRRVYDSRHLQADCQEPRSSKEPYARQSSMGLRNDLYCVEWGVKLYSNQPATFFTVLLFRYLEVPVCLRHANRHSS